MVGISLSVVVAHSDRSLTAINHCYFRQKRYIVFSESSSSAVGRQPAWRVGACLQVRASLAACYGQCYPHMCRLVYEPIPTLDLLDGSRARTLHWIVPRRSSSIANDHRNIRPLHVRPVFDAFSSGTSFTKPFSCPSWLAIA